MSQFDQLAPTHDALWSFFMRGPLGLAAFFFMQPETDVSGASLGAETPPNSHEAFSRPIDASRAAMCAPATSLQPIVRESGGPHWMNGQFDHDGGIYDFKVYVPSAYAGQPLPMIVMLHGAQQDPEDFAAGTEMNATAEAEGYIVVYPQQTKSANPLRCWNWFRLNDQLRASGETAMIAALTREVMAAYNVDPSRVYVAGMSAGGAMAVNLAVTHPDLYAAGAVHSGVAYGVAAEPLSALCAMNDGMGTVRLPDALPNRRPSRTVPLIVFHGDADDTVHPANSGQVVAMNQLLFDGSGNARPPGLTHHDKIEGGYAYTRSLFHDHDGLPFVEHWLVHGLGHAWSGGNPAGTFTDERGPIASREIVRFFGLFTLGR